MRHRLGGTALAMLAVVAVGCGGQAPATGSQAGQPSPAAGPAGLSSEPLPYGQSARTPETMA